MAALLTSSLGARFKVTTASDEVFEGDLFCFDDKSDVAVFHILPRTCDAHMCPAALV